jgi:hypothetical protein
MYVQGGLLLLDLTQLKRNLFPIHDIIRRQSLAVRKRSVAHLQSYATVGNL